MSTYIIKLKRGPESHKPANLQFGEVYLAMDTETMWVGAEGDLPDEKFNSVSSKDLIDLTNIVTDLIPYETDIINIGTPEKIFKSLYVDDASVSGDLTVTGNLTINGTTTTVNSTTLLVSDNVIEVNKDQVGNGVTAGSAGLKVNRGDDPAYYIVFDESDDLFKVGMAGNLEIIATRNYAVQNAGNTPSIMAGLNADKPSAGTIGKLYVSTDTKTIYRDNGTSWDIISTASSDNITEGTTNLFFLAARAIASTLTGLVTNAASTVVTAADSILSALGKLQGQITYYNKFSFTMVIAPSSNLASSVFILPNNITITSIDINCRTANTNADQSPSGSTNAALYKDGVLFDTRAFTGANTNFPNLTLNATSQSKMDVRLSAANGLTGLVSITYQGVRT